MATQDTQTKLEGRTSDWAPASHGLGGAVGGGSRGVERMADFERLRAKCPVAWTEESGGYWTLLGYEDVRSAARDHTTYRSGQPFPYLPDFTQAIPIGLNPPEHTVFRRVLNKFFIPERMSELEPGVRENAAAQLAAILEAGSAEAVSAYCAPITAIGLTALLNLPMETWRELVGHSASLDAVADDPDKLNAMIFQMFAATVGRVVAERKEHPLDPDKDLISGVLAMRVDDEPVPEEMVIGIGVQIISAGHGTTRDGLAGALYLLATNPGDQARLRANPSLIPSAIEEFLRLDPPGNEFARRVARDVEVSDTTIRAGELVAFNYGAANRDGSEFPHPTACLIDREPNRHLSFGHGVHKCVGAPLARMEMRVALEQLLAGTRSFELDGPITPSAHYSAGGLSSLPLRFTAA